MNWNVVAERARLFACIWAALFFGAVVFPSFLGFHCGYPADAPAGQIPTALLYAFLLGFYERDKAGQSKSLVVPFLVCAAYELPVLAWIAAVAWQPGGKLGKRSKSSPSIYITGAIVALWMISALLFPTFQSVT